MYVLQGGIALVVRRGDIETGSKSVSSAFSEREEEMNALPTTVLNTSCTCLLNPRFDHQVPLSLVSSLIGHTYIVYIHVSFCFCYHIYTLDWVFHSSCCFGLIGPSFVTHLKSPKVPSRCPRIMTTTTCCFKRVKTTLHTSFILFSIVTAV